MNPLQRTDKCRRKNCGKKKVCGDCREAYGAQFVASNYDLAGLSQEERMLVFIHACGGDVSGWLDSHTPSRQEMRLSLHHGDIIEEREWSGWRMDFQL